MCFSLIKKEKFRSLIATMLFLQSITSAFAFGRIDGNLSRLSPHQVTKFEYDIAGRMVKRTMPNGMSEMISYDNATGRLMSKTDFRGKTTTFVYETSVNSPNYGKLLQKNPDATLGEPGIVYAYETAAGVNLGKRLSVTYGSTLLNFTYDNIKGQLQSVATLINNTQLGAVAHGYDPQTGEKTSTTTYDGTVASGTNGFEYDEQGRLSKVTNGAATLATYTYNENGSLKTVTRPSAISIYEYDAKNQLLWINHASASNANLASAGRFYYQVDDSGKRIAIHDGEQTVVNGNQIEPTNAITGGTRYEYDLAGRLAKETFANGRMITYAYDKVGNRKTRSESIPGQATQTTSYTYNDNDWLLTESKADGSVTTYNYDENGALVYESTAQGSTNPRRVTREFTFDGKVFAQREYIPGSWMIPTTVTEYSYDGDGNRIGVTRKAFNTTTGAMAGQTSNYYLVDTSQPYAEVIQEWEQVGTGAINLVARYDIGLDRLRMLRANPNNAPPTSAWYLFDGLGSTRALVDDDGVGTDLWGYVDAFGIPNRLFLAAGSSLPALENAFFLNGQQWDRYEGLYFNRARYYQPGLGRFIGEDSNLGYSSSPSTLHKYRYANNNPITIIDPNGKSDTMSVQGMNFNTLIAATIAGGIVAITSYQAMRYLYEHPIGLSIGVLTAAVAVNTINSSQIKNADIPIAAAITLLKVLTPKHVFVIGHGNDLGVECSTSPSLGVVTYAMEGKAIDSNDIYKLFGMSGFMLSDYVKIDLWEGLAPNILLEGAIPGSDTDFIRAFFQNQISKMRIQLPKILGAEVEIVVVGLNDDFSWYGNKSAVTTQSLVDKYPNSLIHIISCRKPLSF